MAWFQIIQILYIFDMYELHTFNVQIKHLIFYLSSSFDILEIK